MKTVNKKKIQEILRFAISGGLCFGIEFIILVLLKELLHFDVLIATPIAFAISVLMNYLLCVKWVWNSISEQGYTAKVGFAVTSVIGLVLNELLMLLFRIVWGETTALFSLMGFTFTSYMLNKSIATLIVMIWNFFTKKTVLRSVSK